MNAYENYAIHDSKTGEELTRMELPSDHVENLSSDSAEGHFRADGLGELSEFGQRSVYAILL